MNFELLLREKHNFDIKPQQRDAVLNTTGPMLLLAVPGSGKTTIIALRCANLALCSGAAPGILAIAHNSSSRNDLEARIRGFLGPELPQDLLVTTMVDFCSLVMKEYAELTGGQPPKLIESSKRRLLRNLYAQLNGGEYLQDNQLEETIASISKAKHDLSGGKKAGKAGKEPGKFARITEAYEAYMHANQCADSDWIQAEALTALSERPDLLEKLQTRFPYINVDEAQEVSRLQFEILKKLATPNGNLFLAGDRDQQLDITACPACLSDFSKIYPQAKVYRMERNYRSTHVIVDAANRLIHYNAKRDLTEMNTGNEIGMPVEVTVLAESSLIGSHILSRLKNMENPGNALIIYRQNTSAAVIMDELVRERIPFRLHDAKFDCFGHWVAQDILAYMALAHNPQDIAALKRLYRKFNAYITKEALSDATATMATEPQMNALEALLYSSKISETSSARIRKLKEDILNLPGMPPGEAIEYILENLEYGEYLKKACGKGMYLESLLQIVDSLTSIASHTENYSQLLERIGELNTATENAGNSTDPNAVMLASAHMAKGLEFRNVYIIDAYEGNFPSQEMVTESSAENKVHMEEERRLFYVAVTRAAKYAELIVARKVNGIRTEPSRFIHEMLYHEKVRKAGSGRAGRSPGNPQKQMPAKKPAAKEAKVIMLAKAPELSGLELGVGMTVEHKSFGRGIISAYDVKRDIVAVKFDKPGMKKFAASYCMNNGVMKKAESESAGNPA